MANLATCSFRSRVTQNSGKRSGPAGIHRAPGDFSNLSRQAPATRQELLKQNWEYLPDNLRARAERLSSSYKGVPLDKDGKQFGLGF